MPSRLTGADLIRSSSVQPMPMSISDREGGDVAGRTLISGRFSRRILRPGLSLHATDAEEHGDFVARTELPPGLSCIFYLEGALDVRLGNRAFRVDGGRGRGILLNRAEPELFTRFSQSRQRVRKVVVGVSPRWLEENDSLGLGSGRGLAALFANHLAAEPVTQTPEMRHMLEELLRPDTGDGLTRLREEAFTLSLLLGSFSSIGAGSGDRGRPLSAREHALLDRALDFIRGNLAGELTTARISSAAGCSQSVLQRLVRQGLGRSLFAIVRDERLMLAHKALGSDRASVAEAAALAGYATAESFSNAFLRKFGQRPISLRSETAGSHGRE